MEETSPLGAEPPVEFEEKRLPILSACEVTGLLRKRINVLRMLFARILVEICKTIATQCEKKNGKLIWRGLAT